jgi:hypothetical protein
MILFMTEKKKRAGRPKGALDHRTRNLRQAVQSGMTPLEFLLEQMHKVDNPITMRMEAAKSAAPYCHARLQSVVVTEKPYEGDPNSITNEQLAGIISRGSSVDDDAEEEGTRTTH